MRPFGNADCAWCGVLTRINVRRRARLQAGSATWGA
jgi:hypothetical protein